MTWELKNIIQQKLRTLFPNDGRCYGYEEYNDPTAKVEGELILSKALSEDQAAYLNRFAKLRKMKRPVSSRMEKLADPARQAIRFPLGNEGIYYSGTAGASWTIVDDVPPVGCPSRWCPVIPTTNETLGWNKDDKFSELRSWLNFHIAHFFIPWGIEVSGVLTVTDDALFGTREVVDRILVRSNIVEDKK